MKTNVAVLGTGYWGMNHVRVISQLKSAHLHTVCDVSRTTLDRVKAMAESARLVTDPQLVFQDPEIEGVSIATPAGTHFALAKAALEAGKHVLVEKPMTLKVQDAEELVALAQARHQVLMVGHLMLYHPCLIRIREMVRSGLLGEVCYTYNSRLNLGQVREGENALWSLAPHDISMILYVLGETPMSVSAHGAAFLQRGIEDVAFLSLRFPSGRLSQIQLSWLDPHKERKMTIVGTKQMVVFDDAAAAEKLRIYNKGVDRQRDFNSFAEILTLRNGDIQIPYIPVTEPLQAEIEDFIRCIRSGDRPSADGRNGLETVRILTSAQRSMELGGQPMALNQAVVEALRAGVPA